MAEEPHSFFSVARVEAYTDAVFAIAATLLVLDLTTNTIGEVASDAELWTALAAMLPNLLSFVISFLLLSRLWVIHFQQFRELERADGVLLWINNVRLLFIVLIPFTTSLAAEYPDYVAGRVALPVNFFVAALLGHATWTWASAKGGHLLKEEAKQDAYRSARAGLSAVICGAVAAIVSPWVGSWGFLAYVFNGPLGSLLQRRAARQRA
ncbi:TMEM175 family protein [Microbacterium ulmi]|uniref:DUF1211 domain-containing protein n=1 Tax=Microbacterium ulmi TaxID=179095 RepID=A0A7Y2M2G5_9MICO|nr:TMEM175 family protein [Microbacterium ulmi]NII70199.1 putative membrane protein [Microbacterium ulmi]NNH04539.1 DUF1211 domain-containing protein [Microbacterium ulmi]